MYPKIGIRPIIDGRLGGVRESLEETTMNMAKAVANLFANELRYPDGSPVQSVIADSCIAYASSAGHLIVSTLATCCSPAYLRSSLSRCWATPGS